MRIANCTAHGPFRLSQPGTHGAESSSTLFHAEYLSGPTFFADSADQHSAVVRIAALPAIRPPTVSGNRNGRHRICILAPFVRCNPRSDRCMSPACACIPGSPSAPGRSVPTVPHRRDTAPQTGTQRASPKTGIFLAEKKETPLPLSDRGVCIPLANPPRFQRAIGEISAWRTAVRGGRPSSRTSCAPSYADRG